MTFLLGAGKHFLSPRTLMLDDRPFDGWLRGGWRVAPGQMPCFVVGMLDVIINILKCSRVTLTSLPSFSSAKQHSSSHLHTSSTHSKQCKVKYFTFWTRQGVAHVALVAIGKCHGYILEVANNFGYLFEIPVLCFKSHAPQSAQRTTSTCTLYVQKKNKLIHRVHCNGIVENIKCMLAVIHTVLSSWARAQGSAA